MQKVIVIGCPGAGKSTFARALHRKTGLPLYYLDMLWHKPDKSTVSRQEFDIKLRELLQQESWIIDGNYSRTLETRMKECDTVFLLDFPMEVCLQGAKERVGKPRDDMPWPEETVSEELKASIEYFPKLELPRIYTLLKEYSHKNIIIFKNRQEAQEYLAKMI